MQIINGSPAVLINKTTDSLPISATISYNRCYKPNIFIQYYVFRQMAFFNYTLYQLMMDPFDPSKHSPFYHPSSFDHGSITTLFTTIKLWNTITIIFLSFFRIHYSPIMVRCLIFIHYHACILLKPLKLCSSVNVLVPDLRTNGIINRITIT